MGEEVCYTSLSGAGLVVEAWIGTGKTKAWRIRRRGGEEEEGAWGSWEKWERGRKRDRNKLAG